MLMELPVKLGKISPMRVFENDRFYDWRLFPAGIEGTQPQYLKDITGHVGFIRKRSLDEILIEATEY